MPVRESQNEVVEGDVPDLLTRLRAASETERLEILSAHIRQEVIATLGPRTPQSVSLDQPFRDLGLTSMMTVQLWARLGDSLGAILSPALAFQFPTIGSLAEHLLQTVDSPQEASTSASAPPPASSGASGEAERLLAQLRTHLAQVLHLEPSQIGDDLHQLGLDAFAHAELCGRLESSLGIPVAPALLEEHTRLEDLANSLATLVSTRAVSKEDVSLAEPVAIIGIGCRFPGAAGPEAFWHLLLKGIEAIGEVPSGRWNAEAFCDPSSDTRGKVITRRGGFLKRVDEFDAAFFNLSPREATAMDPQQRLLLEVTWEALEHAAIPHQSLFGAKAGIFVGVTYHDYYNLHRKADPAGEQLDLYAATGNTNAVVAGRLAYFLGTRGPAYAIDTACSSSLVASHLATKSLRDNEVDLAIVGGVNLILSPDTSISFSQATMLAPDGRCKTFDASADGYVRSEGCGVVVFKRLRDALRDGDRVLAVIRSSSTNQDGRSNGLTAPNGVAQEAAVREALEKATIRPQEIQYVEVHGTGTPLGDPVEVQALGNALNGERGPSGRSVLGAVKTNIGHTEAAAGIAGLIKACLALEHNTIPGNLNLEQVNPLIPIEDFPFELPTKKRPWRAKSSPRRAAISSFGMSGTNAHVIVEEAPHAIQRPCEVERPLQLLALSARTPEALRELARRYLVYLRRYPGASWPNVCHTSLIGRSHLEHRFALVASSRAEACDALQDFIERRPSSKIEVGTCPEPPRGRLAFILDDVGSDHLSALRPLYRSLPVFREAVDRCLLALAPDDRQQLRDALHTDGREPLAEKLADAAAFMMQYALARVWHSWGVTPYAVMGHGVGEYAAACIAGVFSVEAGLCLLAARHAGASALEAQGIRFEAPQVPLVSSLTGRLFVKGGDEQFSAAHWHRLGTEPAQLAGGLESLRRIGCTYFLELGSSGALTTLGRASVASTSPEGAATSPRESQLVAWLSASDLQGGWEQLLGIAGRYWILGGEIDWRSFEAPYPRRKVALPTYPFERQRYWIETREHDVFEDGKRLPMLGHKIETPEGTVIFDQLLGPGEGFLKDHQVFEQQVVPAAAYVEMALSAAQRLGISELSIEQPLILSRNRRVQVQLRPDAEGETVEVFSAAADSEEKAKWVVHARGRLSALDMGEGESFSQIHSRCTTEVDVEAFYARLFGRGLQYGPSFRCVVSLWRGQGEVLGKVALREAQAHSPQSFTFHPALLDGCLQLGAAVLESSGRTYLPLSFEELALLRPGPREVWCHAKLHEPSGETARIAFSFYDASEEQVASSVVRFKAARAESLRLLEPQRRRWQYVVEWIERGAPKVNTERAWVVLSDGSALSQAVAEKLGGRGPCTVVTLGKRCVQKTDGTWQAQASAEDISRLLEKLSQKTERELGLIDLWSGNADGSAAEKSPALAASATRTLLAVSQGLLRSGAKVSRVVVVTRGCQDIGEDDQPLNLGGRALLGFLRTARLEYSRASFVGVDLEATSQLPWQEQASQVLSEALTNDAEEEVAYRRSLRWVPRLAPLRAALPARVYGLVARRQGVLDSLAWVPQERREPGPGEVEIRIAATGLNFRDVLNALGMYPGDAGALGGDITGVVERVGEGVSDLSVGERVVALATGGLGSHVTAKAELFAKLPDSLSFEDGATIPSTFLTVYLGVIEQAGLKRGERVLIHAGAGGVGLAAIQLAQWVGAEVFATAGSEAKRAYLRQLGVDHVYDSRSLAFGEEVLRATGGIGVDVVLNSLSDEFIGESVRTLKKGGRFVEIGKRGIWTAQQMQAARPDVAYHVLALDGVSLSQPSEIRRLFEAVLPLFVDGSLRALPKRLFGYWEVEQAFRHMQSAKHVGKIVLCQPRPVSLSAPGVHLVTGGLGGVGQALVKWLSASGAREVLLLGRREADAKTLSELSASVAENETEITYRTLDVCNAEAVEALFGSLAGKRVRGIFHCAGVLDDGLLQDQSAERFAKVLGPKVSGAWNLHVATLSLPEPPELFVLFSSASGALGNAGQTSYAAANVYMDGLAAHRRRLGKSGLSVQWGPWATAGMAASLNAAFAQMGMRPLSGAASLKALGELLPEPLSSSLVLDADWARMASSFGARSLLKNVTGSLVKAAAPQTSLAQELLPLSAAQRQEHLEAVVRSEVAKVLGGEVGELSGDKPLMDMGLDSLMAVELRRRLGEQVGKALSATVAFDYPTIRALTSHLLQRLALGEAQPKREQRALRSASTEGIAVIGLACRLPGGANDPASYWRLLTSSGDGISEVPKDRWDIDRYYDPDPSAPGKMATRWGGFLHEMDVGGFEPTFFGISPAEAASMDPQQRLLLETAWEALEDAGIAANRLTESRTGVFIGISTHDYATLQDAEEVNPYSFTGTSFSVAAGRLSYVLGLQGPALALDTACSSSLYALHNACQSLRSGESDVALVGGVNLLLSPGSTLYFSQAGFMALDGHCKTFDASADGYVRSEGAAVIALKRLSDAERDGDRVLAVVRGTAVNQDGRSAGLTAPNGPSQEGVLRQSLANAGVEASSVDYIEAHGTGTQLGDPIEMGALDAVYGERATERSLAVGSVKTNIGHLEAAAGMASLVKVILSLVHEELPAHRSLRVVNSKLQLDEKAIAIPTLRMPWVRTAGHVRRAGISGFAFQGSNAHVILEESPTSKPRHSDFMRPLHVLVLSARSPSALSAQAHNYSALLSAASAPQLSDVCYTAATGRVALAERLAVVASTTDELVAKLSAFARGELPAGVVRSRASELLLKVGWVVGAQLPQDVARVLYAQQPTYHRAFDECSESRGGAASLFGWLSSEVATERKVAELAHAYSLGEMWRSFGVEPTYVVGVGVGDYVSAVLSKALSFEEGVAQIKAGTQEPVTTESTAAVSQLHNAGCRVILELVALAERPVLGEDVTWLSAPQEGEKAWPVLFDSLAEHWVRGGSVDWQGVHAGYAHKKVALPTYPFERQRYWLEVQRPEVFDVGERLPLLGQKVEMPEGVVVFDQLLRPGEGFLKDHQVFEQQVVPAAAFVEMALSAGQRLGLSELSIEQPLILSRARRVQVQVRHDEQGEAVEIFSAAADSEEKAEWVLHAHGRLSVLDIGEGESFSQVRSRCTTELDVEAFYAGLFSRGLQYGPSFRCVSELLRGQGEVVGEVSLGEAEARALPGSTLHPSLLDGCLQLGAAVVEDSGRTYLPLSFEELALSRAGLLQLWCHAQLLEPSGETASLVLRLYDAAEELVGSMVVRLKAARAESLRLLEPQRRRWQYVVEWTERRAPEVETNRAWVVLSDGSALSEAVAAKLSEQSPCTQVMLGEHYEQKPDGTWQAQGSAEDIARLLEELSQKTDRELGLIDLWSNRADVGAAEKSPAQAAWATRTLLAVSQGLLRSGAQVGRVVVVTRGSQDIGEDDQPLSLGGRVLLGLLRTARLEYSRASFVSVDLEAASRPEEASQVVSEALATDGEEEVAYRRSLRWVPRLAPLRATLPSAAYGLVARRQGMLDSLAWLPQERRAPGPGEVEIRIAATGLNFRDVLNALGMYPGDAGALGGDITGVVERVGEGVEDLAVGERVVALATGGLGSHATVKSELAAKLPSSLSFEDGATITSTFLTVYLGVTEQAGLKKGERVLIHAGAGGVGLAAIQLAQWVGAEVFATAGTEAKRAYLHGLGVQHVYDSRSLAFGAGVLADTGGAGVDVVLNSLADEFIDESVKTLRKRGRFVEIGKRGIWTQEQMRAARPDVAYHVIALDGVSVSHPSEIRRLFEAVLPLFAKGALRALPKRLFGYWEVEQAFRHMQSAKHIGKIVLCQPRPLSLSAPGVYLVTGGLGGVGQALVKWLSASGAQHVLLLGRREADAKTLSELSASVAEQRTEISYRQLDVCDSEAVAALFRSFGDKHVRGIFHCAGVLDDGLLQDQSVERFAKVLGPKVSGAWNLHAATLQLPEQPELFVLFSSVSGVLGNAGQANYAAANVYLDGLAAYRRRLGLSGLSVAWGPWATAGMAASLNAAFAQMGMRPLSGEASLKTLGELLSEPLSASLVLDADWSRLVSFFGARSLLKKVAGSLPKAAVPQTGLAQELLPLSAALRQERLEDVVRSEVAKVLGSDAAELAAEQPLMDMGLDSLMAVELRRRLGEQVGKPLSATVAFDYPNIRALTSHLLQQLALGEAQPKRERRVLRSASTEGIAVIGLACRFPGGANDAGSYWRLLTSGSDGISEVPKERWDIDRYYDPGPNTPGKMVTRWGGFLQGTDVGGFEPTFFGISPAEAASMDPQQRLLLETAWEALEDAGIAATRLTDSRTGVFIGISTHDYATLQNAEEVNPYSGTGTAFSVAAGRIAYVLGLQGPAIAMDTACSSSLYALHSACQSLRSGESDVALVGGVNLLLAPGLTLYFSQAGFMAPDGHCKTFDASADGYVRSEGAAVIAFKRLSDAERDGDRVLAVVRGAAVNQDGRSAGLTAPNGPSQDVVLRQSLANAGVEAGAVDYIEAHGTGTQLGDPIEMGALDAVYGERPLGRSLAVGSVKTNVGHLEAAAGMASLVKVILSLVHEELPAHKSLRVVNSKLQLDEKAIAIPTRRVPWVRTAGHVRRAGISGFAFQGSNAHVILEEGPAPKPRRSDFARPLHVLVLSARSPAALLAQAQNYSALLSLASAPQLSDVCHTAAVGRVALVERLAVVGSTASELADKLAAFAKGVLPAGALRSRATELSLKVGFVAGAHASREVAEALYAQQPAYRRAFDGCAASHGGAASLLVGLSSEVAKERAVAQLAHAYAVGEMWRSFGVEPTRVVGVGVADTVSAVLSKTLSFDEGAARLGQAAPTKSTSAAIAELKEAGCQVALELVALAEPPAAGDELIWLSAPRQGEETWPVLLTSLAEHWVRGGSVDWSGFDAGYGYEKVALPTYPFERQHYWLEAREPEVSDLGERLPLLGQKVETPEGVVLFEQVLRPGEGFLKDHRVFEQQVVPAAAFVEMALSGGGRLGLSELSIDQPLVLSRARRVQVHLHSGEDGATVEIFSTPAESDDKPEWVEHARGRLAVLEVDESESFAEARSRCTAELDVEAFYADLFARGLQYGSGFRCVSALWRGQNEAVGEVALGEAAARALPGATLHPSLLDGCLHLCAAVLEGSEKTYLPLSFEELALSRPGLAQVGCHAQLLEEPGETARIALHLYDAADELVGSGVVRLKAARAESLRLLEPQRRRWQYVVEWTERRAPEVGIDRAWVVLSDGSALSQRVAEKLNEQGPCTVVALGEGYQQQPDGTWQAQASADDIARLLAELSQKTDRELGLIDLWSGSADVGAAAESPALAGQATRTLLAVSQGLLRSGAKVGRMVVVTRGSQDIGEDDQPLNLGGRALLGFLRTARLEYSRVSFVSVDLEAASWPEEASQVVSEALASDGEEEVAYRRSLRWVPRLVPLRATLPSVAWGLVARRQGMLDSLAWLPQERREPGPGEVEIRIAATGLNFRDVLNALGMYPGDAGALGGDITGVVEGVGEGVRDLAVGERVVALATGGLGSHVTVKSEVVAKLPSSLSFEDGATLPSTFLTVYLGVIEQAGLKKGERVLIHAGAGGVGLAAIALAQWIGAEVFSTAGSEAKRAYLRGLGVEHVYDSRSLTFGEEVLGATGGTGVDVVLNSLSDEFIGESVRTLRKGGRFVEIGKRGIWTAQEMQAARPDVAYHVIALDSVSVSQPREIRRLFEAMLPLFAKGALRALPKRLFGYWEVEQAFRHMQSAKHIGKIVLCQPRPVSLSGPGVHLVTGGLGGVGQALVQWLAASGAQQVLLLGRREADAKTLSELSASVAAQGTEISYRQLDVCDAQAVDELFASLGGKHVRGIFHCAGVLDDGLLQDQTAERFAKVLGPKVSGAWNLHTATLRLPEQPELFVLFSSVSGVLGNAGQANYAAANVYLDGLAAYRRRLGKSGLSVEWGPWATAGMAASLNAAFAQMGMRPLSGEASLKTLGELLAEPLSSSLVLDADWSRLASSFGARSLLKKVAGSVAKAMVPQTGLAQELLPLSAAARQERLEAVVRAEVAKVLGSEVGELSAERPLMDMGLDSLMAVELRRRLGEQVGRPLSATVAFDYPNIRALALHLLQLLALGEAQPKRERRALRSASTEGIAVIGLACRFPGGANDAASYWRLLTSGSDGISEVPKERWDVDHYYDPEPNTAGKMVTRWGGFLKEMDVGGFEPTFFGISPAEAASMDPQQRLLLETAWEALEDAGIAANRLVDSRTGVFIGISTQDYAALRGVEEVNPYTGTGTAFSVAAGRISYVLGLRGPAIAMDTACSSSLYALHNACQSLRSGESDVALVGGVNLLLSPGLTLYFSQAGFMAPDGHCKTFDASANGYVRSEGAAVIALKRLSDAERDGDRVLAVVRGTAVNQDGRSAGLTAPNGPSQEAVLRQSLANAGVEAGAVDYIEAHGTGTQLGDPIEMGALDAVYGERTTEQSLAVGSVKTNVGHLEAAAGMASLVKVILSLVHEELPAHKSLRVVNSKLQLDEKAIAIPTRRLPWVRTAAHVRRAGISGFAFQGSNAHVILEEAPASKPRRSDLARPLHLLVLSARSQSALFAQAQNYSALLSSGLAPAVADVCHTAALGRVALAERLAVVASTASELADKLAALAKGALPAGATRSRASEESLKVGFVVGAHASREVAETLYAQQPSYREAFDSSAAPHGGAASLLGGLSSEVAGERAVAQLAHAYALGEMWRSFGVEPTRVVGVGVADTVSAVLAKVLSFEEGAAQAKARADEAVPTQDAAMALAELKEAGCQVALELVALAEPPAVRDELIWLSAPRQGEETWPVLLESLGEHWVRGGTVNWSGFDTGYGYKKVALPTYPFERQHYWMEAKRDEPQEREQEQEFAADALWDVLVGEE